MGWERAQGGERGEIVRGELTSVDASTKLFFFFLAMCIKLALMWILKEIQCPINWVVHINECLRLLG